MVKSCLRTSKMQKLQEVFSKRQCNYRHTITNSLKHMKVFPTTQTNEQLEASIAWTISKLGLLLGLLLKTQNWVCHVQICLSLSLPSTRSVQTITGADNINRHRPSRTAIGTDRWSRCRQSERERSFDAGAVRTLETQSMYRVEPNQTDTNRQRNIFQIRDTTSFRCVYILNFFTKTSSHWVI